MLLFPCADGAIATCFVTLGTSLFNPDLSVLMGKLGFTILSSYPTGFPWKSKRVRAAASLSKLQSVDTGLEDTSRSVQPAVQLWTSCFASLSLLWGRVDLYGRVVGNVGEGDVCQEHIRVFELSEGTKQALGGLLLCSL